MTLIDYMGQEKKEEEDSPALKIALMHQYNKFNTTLISAEENWLQWPETILWTQVRIVEFIVPADHRVKFKESEKRDKYLDLAGELSKLWNMTVTVIPIVTGVLGTIPKGFVKGQEDLKIRAVETILTIALLWLDRILRRVQGELWVIDFVWSPVWWEAKTNIEKSRGD